MFRNLCDEFARASDEFTPIPLWFWNDRLDHKELLLQIADFQEKGVNGFMIHPRLGLDVDGGYMGEGFLECVRICVEEAKKRQMKVVLYDEGMYPSGSAHGRVVASNPLFAARCLYAQLSGEGALEAGEEIFLRMALRFDADGNLTDVIADVQEAPEGWLLYDVILGFTGGTIRGITEDEDDGQPNAPKAADILNPDATAKFISYTHEVYKREFGKEFGETIIGIFTDEPSATGRYGKLNTLTVDENGTVRKTNAISWTYGFYDDFRKAGGNTDMLAALLFPGAKLQGAENGTRIYRKTFRNRLRGAFYEPIAKWCEENHIALMGHPCQSQDIDMEEVFSVPGQDLVWRMVEPGNELTSPDSTLAKCSADMARHRGAARNSCEIFGVCGKAGNPWDFPAAEMLWYLNYLFARGVNMIMPHAFYYSLRTSLQWDERAPDVGPGNIWWDQYAQVSDYIKRMCWLNTGNNNNPHAAVLCSGDKMPVESVIPLYEAGYSFNYLTTDQAEHADYDGGTIRIGQCAYDTILIDKDIPVSPELAEKIDAFAGRGGNVCRGGDFGVFMKDNVPLTSRFVPDEGKSAKNVRFAHLTKEGHPFFLMINEGDEWVRGQLRTDLAGACRRFDPFTGASEPVYAQPCEEGFGYPAEIAPWSAVIFGLDMDAPAEQGKNPVEELREVIALEDAQDGFTCTAEENVRYKLCFGEVRDQVDVTVNGRHAGVVMFKPYRLDITELLKPGENTIEWTVTASKACTYGIPVETGVTDVRVEVVTVR